mgnify:CR=1 FL=1
MEWLAEIIGAPAATTVWTLVKILAIVIVVTLSVAYLTPVSYTHLRAHETRR